ncbi:hypothetical protein PF005_g27019 [Phytophthora fragariae]|uniref:Uncharacterized protein n=1 Tax=Phytophthora fragariae TaxID=53985 RepID=A0A6A3HNW0_9STRA|nr:hypothetical protein PF003_g23081 [Phytophthora fragariae]KAE8972156.1 hypothetical protein PF011_g25745 [Phytophthora fragariae]KAE9171744.1 hypothetical protein PF005_g27019 [Phytophthora fragariae]KAE9177411.1 hypothetical protein PF004_g25786 [Phytophthora fragariae]
MTPDAMPPISSAAAIALPVPRPTAIVIHRPGRTRGMLAATPAPQSASAGATAAIAEAMDVAVACRV